MNNDKTTGHTPETEVRNKVRQLRQKHIVGDINFSTYAVEELMLLAYQLGESDRANAELIAQAPDLLKQRDQLMKALEALMNRYKTLIDSGDCGFWKVEDEDEWKQAESALNKLKD